MKKKRINKKQKKNKKGFTLIELLVAMAIMGLLIIMAFPTMRAVQTNNTKKKYDAYGDTVISATKLYVDSYGDDLFDPDRTNEKKVIPITKLREKDLIKDINISDSTCLDESDIKIIKYKDDYTYCLHLKCRSNGNVVYEKNDDRGACKNFGSINVSYTYKGVTKTVDVVKGDNSYKLLTPEKLGFNLNGNHEVFLKWTYNGREYDANSIFPSAINSDINFVAKTRLWQYIINFKKNDSNYSGTMSPKTCEHSKDCVLTNIAFSRTGYTFVNWQKDSTHTYANQANVKTSIGNNITQDGEQINLTAIFRKNTCKVKYNTNGGTLASSHGSTITQSGSDLLVNGNAVFHTIEYGGTLGQYGLADYNNTTYINVIKTDYKVNAGQEWNTKADGTGTTFNQTDQHSATSLCSNLGTGDREVKLYVKWVLNTVTCPAGQYLKKSARSCTKCTANHYCPGGKFTISSSSDQGINNCPSGYGNSNEGSSAATNCYMKVSTNYYVKKEKDSSATKCADGYGKPAHNVYYGNKSSCIKKPTCTITAGKEANSYGWYKTNVSITMTTTGSPSEYGLDTSKKSTNKKTTLTDSTESIVTYYGHVKNDGGSGSCSIKIKIDKTAPSTGSAYQDTNCKYDHPRNEYCKIFGLNFTDTKKVGGEEVASGLRKVSNGTSGASQFHYCYVSTTGGCNLYDFAVCNSFSNAKHDENFAKQGAHSGAIAGKVSKTCAKKIKGRYKVCDLAGNCSSQVTKTYTW